MKLESSTVEQVRELFASMQTRRDLLDLLNLVKPILFGVESHPFELNQLTWYASPKLGAKGYHTFTIRKKSGSERNIHAPVKGLKAIQTTLSFILQCVYEPNPFAMGFTMGRSILHNAELHVGKRYVYNIDLKDFFPSIDQARVWKCLQLEPFNLIKAEDVAEPLELKMNPIKINIISNWMNISNATGKADISFDSVSGKLMPGNFTCKLTTGEKVVYKVGNTDRNGTVKLTVDLTKSDLEGFKSLVSKPIKGRTSARKAAIAHMIQSALTHQQRITNHDHRGSLANLIASICCTEMEVERFNEKNKRWDLVKKNVLPQGAPTSPVITNIICRRLDRKLNGAAMRFGLTYSRYADDITFSSMHNVYDIKNKFSKEIRRIIKEENFHIKESKTRLQKEGYRKEVTGLLVNEKVNVSKRFVKQLRMWLYYWETYGFEKANKIFIGDYYKEKGHVSKKRPDMANVIEGKLNFLSMIKGKEDKTFSFLHERFLSLSKQVTPISIILDTWERDGIPAAMDTDMNELSKN